jgi:hypothetical protein
MTTHAAPLATPRLPSITLFSATYCTDFPKYFCSQMLHRGSRRLLHQNGRVLHRSGKVLLCPDLRKQLRRPSITQSPLTTQKLFFRTTLNRNTTVMLQSTTPRPTLRLATTPQRPSTTPKNPPITQLRTLPSLLHEEFKYYPAPNCYQTATKLLPNCYQTATKLLPNCYQSEVHMYTSVILPTLSPSLRRPIHRSCEVFLWKC